MQSISSHIILVLFIFPPFQENPDVKNCHIRHEQVDQALGLYKDIFIFDKYERYLGIDCDPVSFVARPEMEKSPVRFWQDPITAEKALKAEKKIQSLGETGKGVLGKKCTSQKEQKRILREKRKKKLRQRWCWSLPKMLKSKNKEKYIERCKQKYPKGCNSAVSQNSATMTTKASFTFRGGERDADGECVCDLLREMLENSRQAKHTCLTDKILLWAQKKREESGRTLEPNRQLIVNVTTKMIRHFSGIARRMRQIRCKKRRTRNNCMKRKGIKINTLLQKFQKEIMYKPGETPPNEPSEAFYRAVRNLDGSTRRERLERRLRKNSRKNFSTSRRPSSSSRRPASSSRRPKKYRRPKKFRRNKKSQRLTSSARPSASWSRHQAPG